jgi:transposase
VVFIIKVIHKAMSGKTKRMNKIKQLLRLHLDGTSNRTIASSLDMNKETVNRYVTLAMADNMSIKELLLLDDPVLEHRMKGGNAAYPDSRFEVFKIRLPYLEEEMKRVHVTLQLLWEEYRKEHPDGYSLTQFRYHYNQHIRAQKPSTVLKDTYIAGEKLFIDFAGDTMEYIDLCAGKTVRVQMFVACLPATDYGFALGIPSQKSEDFIYAIISCFRFLGGIPRILVPDNLKSAVIKTDPYEPVINHVLEDMANHYGCVVLPTRPYHAKDKSLVEDHVKLVYRRVYAPLRNERFYSIEELNRAVSIQMQAHNRKRMQQRPCSREEHFLAVEKPELRPLPETDFEIRLYADLKVGMNGCIYLSRDKHSYSVPYAFMGRKVKVVYTRTLVRIYCDGECIATHIRDYACGQYTLEREHLPSHSLAYRDRSPEYYIKRGEGVMGELGEVIRCMFATSTVPPETFYRGCEGLLHLQKNTEPALFKRACEAALLYRHYRYAFILQLVKSKCMGLQDIYSSNSSPVTLPEHGNIRGKEQFG